MTLADVQDLVGKPYAHGARGPDAYDCWGLCVEVYRRRGIDLPDYAVRELTHEETTALILGHAADRADWIVKPDDWCFVFDKRNGHIGLHFRGQVLHCARMLGCIVQRLGDFALTHPRSAFARWRA
jgi:hypothetical protein